MFSGSYFKPSLWERFASDLDSLNTISQVIPKLFATCQPYQLFSECSGQRILALHKKPLLTPEPCVTQGILPELPFLSTSSLPISWLFLVPNPLDCVLVFSFCFVSSFIQWPKKISWVPYRSQIPRWLLESQWCVEQAYTLYARIYSLLGKINFNKTITCNYISQKYI